MLLDPNRNLPALVNASVSAPPRRAEESPRPLDRDDLPILARQTDDERAMAVRLGVRVPAVLDGSAPAGDGRLVGRPYVAVHGRPLVLKAGLLMARVLALSADA